MACLKQNSILDLPDEVIEKMMSFLSFCDLYKLRKQGKRLADCTERVLKKKPFNIAIIGGFHPHYELDDIEVISILKDSMSQINSDIPSIPKGLGGLSGTQLPNGDLIISGGCHNIGTDYNDGYYLYKNGSNQWKKVGIMKMAREGHSSVLIDESLFTTGGSNSSKVSSSNHEEFSIEGGLKDRKEMPIALSYHTATVIDKYTILICGGMTEVGFSRQTFIYDVKGNSWNEGPSLLTARAGHSSCAIQSYDESIKCIIIIGGRTYSEQDLKTTEILYLTERKWAQGPRLPIEVCFTACVALPPTSNFSCVIIGNSSGEESFSSGVYGLDKSLSEWTPLGKIRKGRYHHIALPIS